MRSQLLTTSLCSHDKLKAIAHFISGEFEKGVRCALKAKEKLNNVEMNLINSAFERQMDEALSNKDWISARKVRRRMLSLSGYARSGFDPAGLIPRIEIPDAYLGKILLLSFSGGVVGCLVCLRSNDLHHRDILRNAELEVLDLGLRSTRVQELGGAFLRVEADLVHIWGESQDFGACDKMIAASLVEIQYPGKRIVMD